jgi:hypothetical protein
MSKKWLLVGGVLAGLGALGWYGYQQYLLTSKLCFNVTGYRIIRLSPQNTTIELSLSVRNLGSLAVKVRRYNFNIYAENKYVATVKTNQPLDILPADIATSTVQISLNPRMILQNLGSILQSSSQVGLKNMRMRMEGGMSITKAGIPFYIPIVYNFNLSDYIEDEETEGIC